MTVDNKLRRFDHMWLGTALLVLSTWALAAGAQRPAHAGQVPWFRMAGGQPTYPRLNNTGSGKMSVQNQNCLAQFWKDYSQQLTAVIGALRRATPLPPVEPLPSREELSRIKS